MSVLDSLDGCYLLNINVYLLCAAVHNVKGQNADEVRLKKNQDQKWEKSVCFTVFFLVQQLISSQYKCRILEKTEGKNCATMVLDWKVRHRELYLKKKPIITTNELSSNCTYLFKSVKVKYWAKLKLSLPSHESLLNVKPGVTACLFSACYWVKSRQGSNKR